MTADWLQTLWDLRQEGKERLKANVQLGLRISIAMAEKKISARDLHGITKFSEADISRYRSGDHQISIPRLMHLCTVLDVSPNWLLTGADEWKSAEK